MPAATAPARVRPPHVATHRSRRVSPLLLGALLLAAGLATFAWMLWQDPAYSPGSDMGYRVGLAGSLMMLALLLYPLRKRVSVLRPLGALKNWLYFHMLLGIAGPALILIHSQLQLQSINAAVAFTCMLIVAISGIGGRFLHTRIHHRLTGALLSMQELAARVSELRTQVGSADFLPATLQADLERFARAAAAPPAHPWSAPAHLVALAWRRRRLRSRLLAASGPRHAEQTRLLDGYLEAQQRAAGLHLFQRLFSLWHVLHVPLVVLLIISTLYHVLAVHMY